MRIAIRPAVRADEAFLRDMLYLALFVPPGQRPLPRALLLEPAIARYVDGWGARAGDVGLIAQAGDAAVGAAWLRMFPAATPGYGFVDERTPELTVAVTAGQRGKGVGSRLIARLVEGPPRVSLSCDPANPARRLYLRLGFTPLPGGRVMLRVNPAATATEAHSLPEPQR